MEFDEEEEIYTYPCPCGDKFEISIVTLTTMGLQHIYSKQLQQDDLRDGEDVARCPSCSLIIRVIYDPDEFADDDGEGFTVENTVTVA